MSRLNHNNHKWHKDDLKVIEFMETHPSYLEELRRRGATYEPFWKDIAGQIGLETKECRKIWDRIKQGIRGRIKKKFTPGISKYLTDKRLSFLIEYFKSEIQSENRISTSNQGSGEDSQDEDVFTLDLVTIDKLLGPGSKLDIPDQFWISNNLSPIFKRIDNALIRIAEENNSQNVGSIKENLNIDCELLPPSSYKGDPLLLTIENNTLILRSNVENQNMDSNLLQSSSCQEDPLRLEDDSTSDNIRNDYLRNALNTSYNSLNTITPDNLHAKKEAQVMEIIENPSNALPPKEAIKAEKMSDMETIFDIHKSSDSTTFYRKLGLYVNRFSKKKQEEMRLNICCLVTEIELEES